MIVKLVSIFKCFPKMKTNIKRIKEDRKIKWDEVYSVLLVEIGAKQMISPGEVGKEF